MTDRYPLIANSTASQIQELAAGDNLNLLSSDIVNVGNITTVGNVTVGNFGNVLGNLNIVGNTTSANFIGNLASGNSSVKIAANANVTISSNGQANIVTVSSNGTFANSSWSGNIQFTGNVKLKGFAETVVNGGSVSGTITPDAAIGTIYQYTLTGPVTLNTVANAVAGTSMTLVMTQDSTGSRTLTSSMLWTGGNKVLSTAPNSRDLITLFYDGSTYYASITRGYA
jgi:hypothetical protein